MAEDRVCPLGQTRLLNRRKSAQSADGIPEFRHRAPLDARSTGGAPNRIKYLPHSNFLA